jgi:hypothetical protein
VVLRLCWQCPEHSYLDWDTEGNAICKCVDPYATLYGDKCKCGYGLVEVYGKCSVRPLMNHPFIPFVCVSVGGVVTDWPL